MGKCGLDLTGSGKGQMGECCEHCDEVWVIKLRENFRLAEEILPFKKEFQVVTSFVN